MDIRTAIKGRRSIRRFKPDEVPQEIIRDILTRTHRLIILKGRGRVWMN